MTLNKSRFDCLNIPICKTLTSFFFLVGIQFLFHTGCIFHFLATDFKNGRWFGFLTNWSYLSLCCTLGLDLLHTIFHKTQYSALAARILANIGLPAAFVVTIAYFSLLYKPGDALSFTSLSTHCINSVTALIHIITHDCTYCFFDVLFTVAYALTYLVINIIFTYGSRRPIYKILDWITNPTGSARISVAILAGLVFTQFMIVLFTRFLQRNVSRKDANKMSSDVELSTVRSL